MAAGVGAAVLATGAPADAPAGVAVDAAAGAAVGGPTGAAVGAPAGDAVAVGASRNTTATRVCVAVGDSGGKADACGVAGCDGDVETLGCGVPATGRAAAGDAVDAAPVALALAETAARVFAAVAVPARRVGVAVLVSEACSDAGMADGAGRPPASPPASPPEITHGMIRARSRMAPVISGTAALLRRPGRGANHSLRRPNSVCFTGWSHLSRLSPAAGTQTPSAERTIL